MTYREFMVPTDDEVLITLGVEPQKVANAETTRLVEVRYENGDLLTVSYDTAGRSFRVAYIQYSGFSMESFREHAVRLTVATENKETFMVSRFESDDMVGEMRVRVYPSPEIHDKMFMK